MKFWILIAMLSLTPGLGLSQSTVDTEYTNLGAEYAEMQRRLEEAKSRLEATETRLKQKENREQLSQYIVKTADGQFYCNSELDKEIKALRKQVKDQQKEVEKLAKKTDKYRDKQLAKLPKPPKVEPPLVAPPPAVQPPPQQLQSVAQFLKDDHALTAKIGELQRLATENDNLAELIQDRYKNTLLDIYVQQNLDLLSKKFDKIIADSTGDTEALNELRKQLDELKKEQGDFAKGLEGDALCSKVKSCRDGKADPKQAAPTKPIPSKGSTPSRPPTRATSSEGDTQI